MRIDYIREFVYLARELSFIETAKSFYIAQSALSKHIAALEAELGSRLLVRNSHNVSLTNTGQMFFEGMVEVLKKYDETTTEINKTLSGFSSALRIGYIYETTRDFFLHACREFGRRESKVRIETKAFEIEGVLAALKRDSIDVGITLLPPDKEYPDFWVHTLRREKCFIAVRNTNRLSRQKSVSPEDFRGIDTLFPNPYVFSELSAFLHRKLAGTALEHSAVETSHDSQSIVSFLTLYNGASFFFEHSLPLPESEEGYTFFELEGVDLSVNMCLLWKKTTENSAIPLFASCLDSALAVK